MPVSPRVRRRLERLSGTPRLVLAVVLLVTGTLLALTARAPAAAGPVVVAARGVGAGTVLEPADLTVARQPVDDHPDGALTDPAAAVGRRVVAAVPRGGVLTATGLAPEGFASGLGTGRAVATASVGAGRTAVVAVGDRVRLVVAADADPLTAAAGAEPVTLAGDARVLAVWPAPDARTTTLVVDVDVGAAERLAVLPTEALVGCVVVTA